MEKPKEFWLWLLPYTTGDKLFGNLVQPSAQNYNNKAPPHTKFNNVGQPFRYIGWFPEIGMAEVRLRLSETGLATNFPQEK